jgi:hypothetical protein
LERNSKIVKKQQIIDQSQKDYSNFFSGRKDQSAQGLRKKNSKLMELNTFKIGGDNRELSKKMKYQDYNDNLTLNPTKNYQISANSSNINNNITSINDNNKGSQLNANLGRFAPQKNNNFNIITGNDKKEFNENPMNHTSNEYKQMINNENFDQYGRQIGSKPVNPEYGNINHGGQGVQGMQGNPSQVKGIENLENFSPYYDHYNYRPVSGTNNQKDGGMYNTLPYQGGYVQDKNGVNNFNMKQQQQQQPINSFQNIPQGYPTSNPNYYEKNPYENYKIEPIRQSNQNQQGERDSYQGQGNVQPKTTGKKVDLNNIPIPDHINTVEDYEKYLISLGIDPLTLEYISDSNNNQSTNNNNQQYQQMDYLEKQMGGMNLNSGNHESNSNDRELEKIKNDYGGYQGYQGSNNQQSNPQDRNNAPKVNQQVLYDPHLPNYGTRPVYKNQSTLLLADASAHSGKGSSQFEKKDYEPFVKNKPLVINPCKNLFLLKYFF